MMKYTLKKGIGVKAAKDGVLKSTIINAIADLLNVDSRTIYNYMNIHVSSSTEIPDDKLQIIAQCLECTVQDLVVIPAAVHSPA